MKRVLLYSGGMDSWLIDKIIKPDVKLYVDLGTGYGNVEKARLPKDVEVLELPLAQFEDYRGIIPIRNLFLIGAASLFGNHVILGSVYGDRSLDKSKNFEKLSEDLFQYLYSKSDMQQWYTYESFKITQPFIDYTKTELLQEYINMGGDIMEAFHESFSCYHPKENGEPCWECRCCYKKWVAFALNGYVHNCEAPNYILENILPSILEGKENNRGRVNDEILIAVHIAGDILGASSAGIKKN